MRIFFLSLVLLLQAAALTAQNEVLVNVTLSPPYSHRLDDYLQYRAQQFLTLTNLTQQDQRMKIIGEIRGLGTGLFIKTRLDYVPNQVIILGPGESRSFAGQEITGYFDRSNTEQNIPGDLEADIIRTKLLPQDNYDYCIEVVDINTLKVLGRKCILIPIQYLSPPQPNLPWCGESHNVKTNPVINFSWLPPTGGGMGNANIQYDFYLIPVPAGQDPAQLLQLAMDGQLPGPFFVMENLPTASYFYNTLQDPPLEAGNYVWGIVASDISQNVGIENQGRSAFCTLTIKTSSIIAPMNGNGSDFPWVCDCKLPAQKPGGSNSPSLLQPGVTVMVGQYSMKVESTDGNGNGTGKILVPGFPGGVKLPIWVDFTGLQINASREMMKGVVNAQVQQGVSFLPTIDNPQLQTLPLDDGQIDQLDQYFEQNVEQLVSTIGNPSELLGFRLPLGLDKNIGGQQFVIAITGLHFDATQAAMDAAIVIDLVDAGTQIALSGRGICLKNGMGLCGEGELYLAKNLDIQPLNMYLRGLSGANDPKRATRVVFDKDGFKKFYIEAVYTFPVSMLSKVQGGGQVEASLSAETDKGWSDWVATITIDPFRIVGVNDFAFNVTTAYYDHSSISNPIGMPGDYAEGQPLTWTGFFLKSLSVDLPPIIKRKNSNLPLSGSATNVIIDGNGVTGALSLNNLLAIGDGGDGHWQFSVDQFIVKFLKNTFQSGGFNGKLLLPITSRNQQAQLLYSSLLSYSNQQFEYQFTVAPKNDLEVDLFAAYFNLSNNSNIMVSYTGSKGFEASAKLSGEFRIGGKFDSQLPRINIAHVSFQNLGLKTSYPYYTPGQLQAALGSPQKSVGGFPLSVKNWELFAIGLQADVDLQLSDLAGFLPNASATIKFHGKFDNDGTPAFDHFEMSRLHLDADFSVLHLKGDLDFYSKDATWGDGFKGTMEAVFPPGFKVRSRMQIGHGAGQSATNYWYVDGKTNFGGGKSTFTAGMDAFGFSGGAYYNLNAGNYMVENDIKEDRDPENYTGLGQAPSGVQYSIKNGSSGILASVVIGLGSKEIFNANAQMKVTFIDGGVETFLIAGRGRMFGAPGETGLVNGGLSVLYDFPQKILAIHADLTIRVAIMTGIGSLDTYANGSNGDWNFKLGRPKDYGLPCSLGFKMAIFDVKASAYFECGNYNVDGLPTRLPDIMMRMFPDYATRYPRTDRTGTKNGDAILLGMSLELGFQQNYLIFYGRIDGAFGFDLLLEKTGPCDGYSQIGMNGYYGTGQFYAGLLASIGIEVDLFFVSGKFEILAIGFGGILRGGGPEPTWLEGTVGGYYSILGGMIEGHCNFEFAVGNKCIPKPKDVLDGLKVINEISPKPKTVNDQKVDELQDIFTEPSASLNLRLERQFLLEQQYTTPDKKLETKPRIFAFERDNVTAILTGPNGALPLLLKYDPEGFGIMASPNKLLLPLTNYVFTVNATLFECGIVETQQSGDLTTRSCGGGWFKAKKQNGQEFKDTRTIKFTTNDGLIRLPADQVVYSLPHHGQRFYCYEDFTKQAILALEGDRERAVVAESFQRPDRTLACRIKMRLIPAGQDADALPADEVTISTGGQYDPSLDQGNFGESKYYVLKGNGYARAGNYWIAPMLHTLQRTTNYGVQFFLEWDKPPSNGNNTNMGSIATTVKTRTVAMGMAVISERELNLKKYRLGSNQREVYRYFFKSSQYSSIEQKIKELERNQLIFKDIASDINFLSTYEINEPDSRSWATVAQRLKAKFPPDMLDPKLDNKGTPKGIFLKKAGYDGPERFDVFDVKGYEKTIKYKTYKILPLLDLESGDLQVWWDAQFSQVMDTLLQNGIKQAVFRMPGVKTVGWQFSAPKLKINYVMDSIRTNDVLGGLGNSMSAPIIHGIQLPEIIKANNTNTKPMVTKSTTHLVEVSRGLELMMGSYPGMIPHGNQWVKNIMNGGWMDVPGPFQNQLLSNLGAAYDFVSKLSGPAFNSQNIGAGIGGIKINALQAPGAVKSPAFQIGGR